MASPITPRSLKGAFIRLDEGPVGATPQVISFQYNPESLARKLKPYEKPADKEGDKPDAAARATPYDPEEEFEVAIFLDATDDLEHPDTHPQAVITGVADRIAALEVLMYPSTDTGLLTPVLGAVAGLLGIPGGQAVPQNPLVPVVLFAFGPGRIVPVKITSFAVEEQAFNLSLFPIRAKVTVGVKVLTDDYFNTRAAADTLTPAEGIAAAAYRYTRTQKRVLAASNVGNNVASALSLLPF
jgi:hypothetical protein